MPERCMKYWFKLAFRLFVTPDYKTIAEKVDDTDVTYRWLRELVLVELEKIRQRDSGFVGSAASNLRDRLTFIRHVNLDEETYARMKFWLKSLSGLNEFKNSENDMSLRLDALKIGLLEASFVYFDDPKKVENIFQYNITQVSYNGYVQEAVLEKADAQLATQTKIIVESAGDYLKDIGASGDFPDAEFKFPADWPPSVPKFKPPAIWVFGSYGLREGQMPYPEKLLIDAEGRFLVLEEDVIGMGDIKTVQRVQLFSQSGKYLKTLVNRGEGGVNGMYDMALDNQGNLLVSDKNEQGFGRIHKFDVNGKCLMKITASEIRDPENKNFVYTPKFTSISVDGAGRILAGDPSSSAVHVYSPEGALLFRFGKAGKADGEFQQISGVFVDSDGNIYVSDEGREKVQVFDKDGKFLSQFGGDGLVLRRLVFDSEKEEVIASDYFNHKLKVFNMNGELLRESGKYGTGLGDLWFPYGLALTKDGKIAVAERENHRIKVYTV